MKTRFLALTSALLVLASAGRAQWLTQTNDLKAGWNAVYLHLDLSHTNIAGLVNALDPIEEIWLWNPDLPPGQATATPQLPNGSQWSTWTRIEGPASVLQTLRANSALLVRVTDGVGSFEWKVKGRPVAPANRWTLTGLNFVGFPTELPSPNFEAFLEADAQEIAWSQSSEIFRYQGGSLGTTNPIRVQPFVFRTTPVKRDQAYWVRVGEVTNQIYNHYFGPFQVHGSGSSGIRFGDALGQTRLYLKNLSRSNLTITLQQVPSETTPPGHTAIAGTLPLLVRGPINTTNLTFGYSNLATGAYQWTLPPKGEVGSEVEVILGINRAQMGGTPGAEFAGVLRFTDSLGLTRVDIGASAVTPSRAGLWVGSASAEYVSQYLKPYAKATNAADFAALLARLGLTQGGNGTRYEWDPNTGRVLVFGTNRTGSYLLDGPIKLDSGGVARPFPLRLIVHNDGATAKLMQRAYLGLGGSSNLVVATREEALLPSGLATARRVSAVHLPTSDGNGPWMFSGTMQQGSTITTTIQLGHDDHASNPLLHTYHPDHDNLDAQFATVFGAGVESYGVRRVISLQFSAPLDNFDSLTRSGANLTGSYAETVTFTGQGGDLKQFNVLGSFNLARITDIATLTTNP